MDPDVKDPTVSPVEIDPQDQHVDDPNKETTDEPGTKTDPNLLLQSLQEERRKRREAEALLKEKLENPSEEGAQLQGQINALKDEIKLKDLVQTLPALKDKLEEFKDYLQDYPGMPMESVAKVFLLENGLLTPKAPRKGLENQTGGTRTPIKTGMTEEDAADLRNTNYRKYAQLVREGKIKIS